MYICMHITGYLLICVYIRYLICLYCTPLVQWKHQMTHLRRPLLHFGTTCISSSVEILYNCLIIAHCLAVCIHLWASLTQNKSFIKNSYTVYVCVYIMYIYVCMCVLAVWGYSGWVTTLLTHGSLPGTVYLHMYVSCVYIWYLQLFQCVVHLQCFG